MNAFRTTTNAMSCKKFLKYDFNAMEHAPKISTLWIFFIEKFSTVVFCPSVYFSTTTIKRLTKLVATPILEHDFKMHCVSADSLSSDKESSYKSDTERLPANYARKPVSIFLKE